MPIQDDAALWKNPFWSAIEDIKRGLDAQPKKTLFDVLGASDGRTVQHVNDLARQAGFTDPHVFAIEAHEGGRRFLYVNHPGGLSPIPVKVAEPIYPNYEAETQRPKIEAIQRHLSDWQQVSAARMTAVAFTPRMLRTAGEVVAAFVEMYAREPDARFHITVFSCDERGSCSIQHGEPDPSNLFAGPVIRGGMEGVWLNNGEVWGFGYAAPAPEDRIRVWERFQQVTCLAGAALSLDISNQLGVLPPCHPSALWMLFVMKTVESASIAVGKHRAIRDPYASSIQAAKQLEAQEARKGRAAPNQDRPDDRTSADLQSLGAAARCLRNALHNAIQASAAYPAPSESAQLADRELSSAIRDMNAALQAPMDDAAWSADMRELVANLRTVTAAVATGDRQAATWDTIAGIVRSMVESGVDVSGPTIASEFVNQSKPSAAQELKPLPTLTPSQNEALRIIRERQPIGGKELAAALGMDFGHIRKWFGPKGVLAAHGVINLRDGSGYRMRGTM